MNPEILYIVVPCYNEEEVLPLTAEQLRLKMLSLRNDEKISPNSRILFVDDGSKDRTWSLIETLCRETPEVFSGVKLSRNCGHQKALLAGLLTAKQKADMIVSIDADLQDELVVIDGFVAEYYKGNQIVYGVRGNRDTDSGFKRKTAQTFYKIMQFLGVDIIYNHADCRLMSRLAVEQLETFEEQNLFLRGIVPLIGYQHSTVEYKRQNRQAGESKYPVRKMFSFAWDGVTSFSVKPIRLISSLGLFILLISGALILYALLRNAIGKTIVGWSSLMISIWFLGGLQIFSIGVVGEYIGKIYAETKRRPKYIIEKIVDSNGSA